MKIYTKTGDTGETSLLSGTRVSKAEERIDLYGDVDELNSRIGHAVAHLDADKFSEEIKLLHQVQCELFNLGSLLACEKEKWEKFQLISVSQNIVLELESSIDKMNGSLPPLTNFILPGGSSASALTHLCRTCTRSVERKLIHFFEGQLDNCPDGAMIFLNRLSDYFFVLSRFVNFKLGVTDIIWRK